MDLSDYKKVNAEEVERYIIDQVARRINWVYVDHLMRALEISMKVDLVWRKGDGQLYVLGTHKKARGEKPALVLYWLLSLQEYVWNIGLGHGNPSKSSYIKLKAVEYKTLKGVIYPSMWSKA